MDPLSIAASLIALIGAAEKIAVGIDKLASLRNAPASVLALNNELSDLRLVLREVEPLIEKHYDAIASERTTPVPAPGDSTLLRSIQRAKVKLVELESIVQNRLMVRMGVKDKLAWTFEQDKVVKAKDDLRTARLNITAALGVATSAASFRLETQLQDIQLANIQGQQLLSQRLLSQGDTLDQAIACMMETQRLYEERIADLEKTAATNWDRKDFEEAAGSDTSYKALEKTHHGTDRRYSDSSNALFEDASFSALRMRFLRRRKCAPWCDCACHKHSLKQTPSLLQPVLGTLFVGYAGLPMLTPSCTSINCQRTSEAFVQVNYYFPPWFLAQVLSIAIRCHDINNLRGSHVSVRTLNIRSSYDGIFQSSIRGDANAVKNLLMAKKASVLDVTDDSGHSALHLAVMDSHVEVIEVLLGMGSEPYLENRTQETPYDQAWNTIFSFQGTPSESAWRVADIRRLFPTLESVEERRRFTRIHKVVLKILHMDLEKELLRDRSLIDQVDADGKTALAWAAARGDSKFVESLLRNGANPDIPDRIGQGPLRQSMKAHDPTCTRLLLTYGARVDQTDNWMQTALQSALYYPNSINFMKPLLRASASVNLQDNRGHTPLMEATALNTPDAVLLLLARGADPNLPNHQGATPLHHGVRHNSHEALDILLVNRVNASIQDRSKRTVLHWAAESADSKTLGLLKKARLNGLNVHDQSHDGLTAIDIAEKRRNDDDQLGKHTVDSAWIVAFADFLQSLVSPISSPISPKTPKSMWGGSDVSDDFFVDAVQHLTFGDIATLAEEGFATHPG